MTANTKETPANERQANSRLPRGMVALALAFLLADFLLLQLPIFVSRLSISGTHWNWSGKIFSIAFSCAVLACSPWLRQNVGLRLRQSLGSFYLSLGCFLLCAGVGIAFGFNASPAAFPRETLLFQTLMPGLDEELAVRGIALALLERAFACDPMGCRLRYGRAALVTSLLFGLGHSVTSIGGHFTILPIPFISTFGFASIAALVRTRSGSLVWPMLCHSAWDGLLFFLPMIR